MRILRYLSGFIVALIAAVLLLWAVFRPDPVEQVAVAGSLLVCVQSIATNTPVSVIAPKYRFIDLPPEKAALFGQDLRSAYAVPPHVGKLTLAVNKQNTCQIFIRRLNAKKFWQAVDDGYEKEKGPFTRVSHQGNTADIPMRSYEAQIKGQKIRVLMSAGDKEVKNGVQGLITVSRVP